MTITTVFKTKKFLFTKSKWGNYVLFKSGNRMKHIYC